MVEKESKEKQDHLTGSPDLILLTVLNRSEQFHYSSLQKYRE